MLGCCQWCHSGATWSTGSTRRSTSPAAMKRRRRRRARDEAQRRHDGVQRGRRFEHRCEPREHLGRRLAAEQRREVGHRNDRDDAVERRFEPGHERGDVPAERHALQADRVRRLGADPSDDLTYVVGRLRETVDVVERIDRGELRGRPPRFPARSVQRQDRQHDVAPEVGKEMPRVERLQVDITPHPGAVHANDPRSRATGVAQHGCARDSVRARTTASARVREHPRAASNCSGTRGARPANGRPALAAPAEPVSGRRIDVVRARILEPPGAREMCLRQTRLVEHLLPRRIARRLAQHAERRQCRGVGKHVRPHGGRHSHRRNARVGAARR